MKLHEMSPAIRRVVGAANVAHAALVGGSRTECASAASNLGRELILLAREPDVSVDGVADALPVVRDDERRDAAHAALKALGLEIPEGGE